MYPWAARAGGIGCVVLDSSADSVREGISIEYFPPQVAALAEKVLRAVCSYFQGPLGYNLVLSICSLLHTNPSISIQIPLRPVQDLQVFVWVLSDLC